MPPERLADRVHIRDVPLPGVTGKQEFLYLSDFGDDWQFGVKLVRTADAIDPTARYPRVVAIHGDAPPRYPLWDDDDEEWDGGPAADQSPSTLWDTTDGASEGSAETP